MRDAYNPPSRTGFTCDSCRRFITTSVPGIFHNPPTGSPRRFCTPACRTAAWRRRRAGAPEDTPLQHQGGSNRSLHPHPKETPTKIN